MATKDYIVQTEGNRQLLLSKQDDGNYQVKIFLNRPEGQRTLATLIVTPQEWKKLAAVAEGLKRK